MSVSQKEYSQMVKKSSPPSPGLKNFILAYLVGGIICVIGQLLTELYQYLGLQNTVVKMLVPVSLIFLASLLTGLKIFHKIAKHAGAGTLVPITGFSNAVSSPAIEFKNEGWILGVGAKIFTIAGPVIAYGIFAGAIYGVIYWIMQMI